MAPVERRVLRDSNRPTVLLAAKTYGSVFYDKLTPSIVQTKWSIRNYMTMEQWGDASRSRGSSSKGSTCATYRPD
jgi:hypothetical protein